jgi:hypothetical protein
VVGRRQRFFAADAGQASRYSRSDVKLYREMK